MKKNNEASTIIDLFCGCGGLSVGFAQAGFRILLGVDLDPVPLRTFARNFPGAKAIQADISHLDPHTILRDLRMRPGDLDCLVGGPPCQGFSKNIPAKQRYLGDPKNALILRFLDFVEVLRPKVVLIENVAEMVNAYDEAYASAIMAVLGRVGYKAGSSRLLASDYGAPQHRRRAFFFANSVGCPVVFPPPTNFAPGKVFDLFSPKPPRGHVSVWDAIGDLPKLKAGEGSSPAAYSQPALTDYQRLMRKGSRTLYDHMARSLAPRQLERVKHLTPGAGEGAGSLPRHLRPKSGYSGAYARLIPNEPARTITRWVFHPGSGRFYHPYDDRVITIREAARLQSFPDWFIFEGTYIQKSRQIGEAVPPLLAQAFAELASDVLVKANLVADRQSLRDRI